MNWYVLLELVLAFLNFWMGFTLVARAQDNAWMGWVLNLPVGLLCLWWAVEVWK